MVPVVVFSEEQEQRVRELVQEELGSLRFHLAEMTRAVREMREVLAETPEVAADPAIVPEEVPEPYDVRENEEGEVVAPDEVQGVSEAAAVVGAGASRPVLFDGVLSSGSRAG